MNLLPESNVTHLSVFFFASESKLSGDFYSLLDAVDRESIAGEFGIRTYNKKRDFDNHLKVGIFEGVNTSADESL